MVKIVLERSPRTSCDGRSGKLQFANLRVNALNNTAAREVLREGIKHRLPQVLAIEGLGERLHGENIVALVNNEPRQQVSLAEDDTIGITVADDLLAKLHCAGDTLAQQRWELRFGDFVAAQPADGDL
jgi:hypothetical protein